ncbi:MAG: SPOR domain-containing protein [Bacteroidia bacterium]
MFSFLALFFLITTTYAQEPKDEKKFWKDKAKMYTKNPLSLKAEFENYQEQIKDLKARNKELMKKGGSGQSADLVDSLRWALIQMEGELQAQRSQKEKLEKAYNAQKTVNDMGIQAGLTYRVQIGAYVFYEMGNAPEQAGDFVAERADGFNKYVIGSFRVYDEAQEFRDELRKMGMKDAWVVPYLDGVRVTIDEANRYLEKQGKNTFLNN